MAFSATGQEKAAIQQEGQQQASDQQTQQQQAQSKIKVMAASSLVGRTVQDKQGNDAGEIEYLMIDIAGGDVRYAVIGSGGTFDIDEEFVAVPWSAVKLPSGEGQEIQLNTSLDRLTQAPRISMERLFELTQPAVVTQVYEYYLVPEQDEGQRGGTQEQGQAEQGESSQEQVEQPQQSAQTQQGEGQQEQSTQAQQGEGQQGAQTQQGEGQQGGSGAILVSQEIVTMLAPPAFVSANEVRGTAVESATGEEIGEIDQLMIDVDHGRVAYVLLERGGFLELGEEWVPVPFQALGWDHDEGSFTLLAAEEQLQNIQGLPKGELPTQVSLQHLKDLYQRYGVAPYQEREQPQDTLPPAKQQ